MGDIPPWIVHSSALGSNMKMFAVLALAAVAFAEPEPQVVYSGVPVSTVYNNPLTYSSPLFRAFTPYTTYNGLYRTPVVHSIGKRDADADPATVYTTGVPVSTYGAVHHVAGVNNVVASVSPVSTYTAVNPVSTYTAARPVASHVVPATYAASHVVQGAYAPHSVAATPFGYTHSSNVGVCTNNMGVQVPC